MTNPIFCALDSADLEWALSLTGKLAPLVGGVKLGLEFFSANGADGVRAVSRTGTPVFLDLKFHDIPNTVAGAISSVAPLAPLMTTIHTLGGRDMMKAAVEAAANAAEKLGVRRMKILGVTMLTSMAETDLDEIGVKASSMVDQVKRLAVLAQESGVDGIVASPHEIEALRRVCGPDFLLVIPGIRPLWAESQDQKRVLSPKEALDRGASHLVIGRPITKASNPAEAAKRIIEEIR